MTKKKTLLVVLSVVMVCAVSIMGTLAYLTKTTPAVSNTFVAAGGGEIITPPETPDGDDDPINQSGFFLYEHKATKQADGTYKLATGTTGGALVQSNSYDVLPGNNIPKDPFLKLSGLNSGVQVYMYVEVVDTLGASLTYEMDTAWTKLADVTGKNGGTVYVYNNTALSADVANAPVLKNNTLTVAGTGASTAYAGGLNFYGYLCQSTGFASASAAFTACFAG